MKLLKNPENGAPIQGVNVGGTAYFTDQPFEPDSIISIEDDKHAQAILETFGFLKELTPEDAKAHVDLMNSEFKCEKCGRPYLSAAGLANHMKKHEKEVEVDSLGIPIVRGKTKEELLEQVPDKYELSEREDRAAGLVGEGLVIEKPSGKAVMK